MLMVLFEQHNGFGNFLSGCVSECSRRGIWMCDGGDSRKMSGSWESVL
jgi:hypothetical protein